MGNFKHTRLIQTDSFSGGNSETWNDAAIEAAWDQNTPAATKPVFVYAASKTEAERSAFKWVEDHGRPFVLNSVLPCMTVRLFSHSYSVDCYLSLGQTIYTSAGW